MDATIFSRSLTKLRSIQTLSRNVNYLPIQQQTGFVSCTRCLSSMSDPKSSSHLRSSFRTQETDPRKHTNNHEGMFYRIPESTIKGGVLDKCVAPVHLRLMETFNDHSLMVRQPSLELNGYLANLNLSHPVPRFVLYGRAGAGKKCSLLHTLHYCALNDWLIVHVPWAGQWIRGFYGYKEVTESSHKTGRYDLPNDAAAWLTHFQTQNKGRLDGLVTKNEYIWTKREKAEVGTPLTELIDFGLRRVKFSCDCVGALLKELREQAATEKLKVLVAVESANAFFVPYMMQNTVSNSEKRKLLPHEVSLIHNFKKMLQPTWSHGAVVCTVKDRANQPDKREAVTPLYLLGQEGFEWLDPFVPIHVPEYSEKEALSTIDYYIDRNWIQKEYGKTDEAKKQMMFVSNKNGFDLYKLCSGF